MNISHKKTAKNDKIVIKINSDDNIVIKQNRCLLQKEIWKNKADTCHKK